MTLELVTHRSNSSIEDIAGTLRKRKLELEREIDKQAKILKSTLEGMKANEQELKKVQHLIRNL